MNKSRFYVAWVLSALIMYGLAYLWHGVFLNDLSRVQTTPMPFFMGLLGVVYLALGFVLSFIASFWNDTKNIAIKGALIGGVIGFLVYLIAYVMGVSFTSSIPKHLIVDFIWQMFEQAVGGYVVAMVFAVGLRRDDLRREAEEALRI